MKDLKKIKVSLGSTIRSTIQIIDTSAMQIALVVSSDGKLVGTVTDGDVRRALLAGISLEDIVDKIMNKNPTVCSVDEDREIILTRMKAKGIHHMPLVDASGFLMGLETIDELMAPKKRENIVVLMAGGLGSRLGPLTEDCPKPMLKIGGRPILETILLNFIEHGFMKFYISLNYKPEVITEYFGDGSQWGVEISYLHEDKKLGTAGALSLIPKKPTQALLVMNGDLLTKINFSHLLDSHLKNHAKGTMCVREYDFQVPYGVVKIDNNRIIGIDEKPLQRFFVNAGIYVLEPEVLDMIPADSNFDMPTLFEKMIEEKQNTSVFPIREYWLDIGQMADFDRAKGDFVKVFK
ncbi:MAG: nucleotidyltransferase family protein [Bacteriovorax sp.]|nr:nucleotidyltransferase family protein [Bacteriovorax sp.]